MEHFDSTASLRVRQKNTESRNGHTSTKGKRTATQNSNVQQAMDPTGAGAIDMQKAQRRWNILLAQAGEIVIADEQDPSALPTIVADPTPRPAQAYCCDAPTGLRHSLLAGVGAALSSSGYVILSKDFIEFVVASALVAYGFDPTDAPYNYIIAMAAGTVYGLTHQALSRFTAGLLNARFGVTRYTPTGEELQRQLHEFYAATLPGLISYTLFHSLRGMAMEGNDSLSQVAFGKLLASILAGGFAGLITDVICQKFPEGFRATKPLSTTSANLRMQMETLLAPKNWRDLGREFIGKTFGSLAGMLASVPLARGDLPGAVSALGQGAAQSALARFLFQFGFYAGIHAGAAIGNEVDERAEESESDFIVDEESEDDSTSLTLDGDQVGSISALDPDFYERALDYQGNLYVRNGDTGESGSESDS